MEKEPAEMTLEELWDLFPIFLVRHDDHWNEYYNEIKSAITDLLTGYEDMSAKQTWKAYKDNPFLILADAAIKDYTSHYNTQGADLRKKHSYINNRLQKYRGLPVVQLGNELRTEMHYYEFHRCILCPRTRSFQLQKHNLLQ